MKEKVILDYITIIRLTCFKGVFQFKRIKERHSDGELINFTRYGSNGERK